MKPVIIGAGRGRRLKHLTDEIPKTLVPIVGRPMLESILEALEAGGFSRDEVVFICGYKADVIQDRYPALTYVENRDWPNNNILLSLLCARPHLEQGFVSTYADIVYRPEAIAKVATDNGLDADAVQGVLQSDAFASDVRLDEQQASQLGIRGVPFFVLDRRYAIQGAQTADTVLSVLRKAHQEMAPLEVVEGAACGPDGC